MTVNATEAIVCRKSLDNRRSEDVKNGEMDNDQLRNLSYILFLTFRLLINRLIQIVENICCLKLTTAIWPLSIVKTKTERKLLPLLLYFSEISFFVHSKLSLVNPRKFRSRN